MKPNVRELNQRKIKLKPPSTTQKNVSQRNKMKSKQIQIKRKQHKLDKSKVSEMNRIKYKGR